MLPPIDDVVISEMLIILTSEDNRVSMLMQHQGLCTTGPETAAETAVARFLEAAYLYLSGGHSIRRCSSGSRINRYSYGNM